MGGGVEKGVEREQRDPAGTGSSLEVRLLGRLTIMLMIISSANAVSVVAAAVGNRTTGAVNLHRVRIVSMSQASSVGIVGIATRAVRLA